MFGPVLSRRLCQQVQAPTRVPFVDRPDHGALVAAVIVHVRHHGLIYEKAPGPVTSWALSSVHLKSHATDVPRERLRFSKDQDAHLCVGALQSDDVKLNRNAMAEAPLTGLFGLRRFRRLGHELRGLVRVTPVETPHHAAHVAAVVIEAREAGGELEETGSAPAPRTRLVGHWTSCVLSALSVMFGRRRQALNGTRQSECFPGRFEENS